MKRVHPVEQQLERFNLLVHSPEISLLSIGKTWTLCHEQRVYGYALTPTKPGFSQPISNSRLTVVFSGVWGKIMQKRCWIWKKKPVAYRSQVRPNGYLRRVTNLSVQNYWLINSQNVVVLFLTCKRTETNKHTGRIACPREHRSK